jgi:hypothetical protein
MHTPGQDILARGVNAFAHPGRREGAHHVLQIRAMMASDEWESMSRRDCDMPACPALLSPPACLFVRSSSRMPMARRVPYSHSTKGVMQQSRHWLSHPATPGLAVCMEGQPWRIAGLA